MFDSESGNTTITWNPSTDPPFPDGYHGSGVGSYSYRYQLNGGAWSARQTTQSTAFVIPSTTNGEHVTVEVNAVDLAKNSSPIASVALTTTGPTLTAESPGAALPGYPTGSDLQPEGEEWYKEAKSALAPSAVFTAPESTPASGTASPQTTYTEKLCGSASSPCGKYNGAAAAAYAERWSLNGQSDEEASFSHNPEYDYFYRSNAGDCADFVSQALKAGGMQYMRAHGDSNPDAEPQYWPGSSYPFEKGQGSWWSNWTRVPVAGSRFSTREYSYTESFVLNSVLYKHLMEYGLARVVKGGEPAKAGDIVFFNLKAAGLAASELDHAEMITSVTHTATFVAQHTKQFGHRPLGNVIKEVTSERGAVKHGWNYVIVEPTHTAANITS
jgi:hypothetical protein